MRTALQLPGSLLLAIAAAAGRPCDDRVIDPAARATGDADVPVQVERVAFDPNSGSSVVLLEEDGGSRVLPILIPMAAARSIASEMQNVTPPRPNTHDLAKRLLDRLEGQVERVIVTELRGGTFYAVIEVRSDGRLLEIDARPSDAIAIALRVGAPLFVRESVLEQAGEEGPDETPDRRATRRARFAPRCATSPATAAPDGAPRFAA